MVHRNELSLGEIIATLYQEYLEFYGDEDIASVATAASVNQLLMDSVEPEVAEVEAA